MEQIEVKGSLWILDGQERVTTKGKSRKQIMDDYVKDCLIGVFGKMIKTDSKR